MSFIEPKPVVAFVVTEYEVAQRSRKRGKKVRVVMIRDKRIPNLIKNWIILFCNKDRSAEI